MKNLFFSLGLVFFLAGTTHAQNMPFGPDLRTTAPASQQNTTVYTVTIQTEDHQELVTFATTDLSEVELPSGIFRVRVSESGILVFEELITN